MPFFFCACAPRSLASCKEAKKTTKYNSPAPRYRNQTQLPRAPNVDSSALYGKNYAALFRKIPFKFRQSGEYT